VDFQNSGIISSGGQNSCAVCITIATVNNINNSGTLSAEGTNAFGIDNTIGTIDSITNTGVIYGDDYGISNSSGTISVLNNLQGGDGLTANKTALTYSGRLPTEYNIIISSTSHYGQLNVDNNNYSGSLTFGISNLSLSNIGVSGTRYQNVISGVASGDILNIGSTGTYSNGNLLATYELVNDDGSVADTWDLLILSMINGPSATDTQQSLRTLTSKLRGAFSGQTVVTNFANMNTYDCNLFDAKGLCVSVGGQQTYVDSPSANMTSAVVVAGYKVSPTLRIGGFLNQNVNSNTGSNVDISNNSPLMGLFAVWNQNENHLGYQVKIANAYQDMDVTTTRDVIGTSEAGKGKTDLNTQSYVGELSYAFLTNEDKTLVRPYAALRYTRIKQDSYTERTTTAVTAPLTYAALSDRSTAALVGVKLNHKLTDKVNLTGSLGVEQDLNHDVDNLTASGVNGLTSEAFNNNINRTRPVASIGAYYMPVKNQRIAADIYYQELPFQSTAATTAYVNYMIGF
jgi:outer membrane autotransporter protein